MEVIIALYGNLREKFVSDRVASVMNNEKELSIGRINTLFPKTHTHWTITTTAILHYHTEILPDTPR